MIEHANTKEAVLKFERFVKGNVAATAASKIIDLANTNRTMWGIFHEVYLNLPISEGDFYTTMDKNLDMLKVKLLDDFQEEVESILNLSGPSVIPKIIEKFDEVIRVMHADLNDMFRDSRIKYEGRPDNIHGRFNEIRVSSPKTHVRIEIDVWSHGTTVAEEVHIRARDYLKSELRRNGTSFSITSDAVEAREEES